jgi:hypothetical protein
MKTHEQVVASLMARGDVREEVERIEHDEAELLDALPLTSNSDSPQRLSPDSGMNPQTQLHEDIPAGLEPHSKLQRK